MQKSQLRGVLSHIMGSIRSGAYKACEDALYMGNSRFEHVFRKSGSSYAFSYLCCMVLSYQSSYLRLHESDTVCGNRLYRKPLHL